MKTNLGTFRSPTAQVGDASTRTEVREPKPAPDLSIVIVSWNTRDLILDCLTSVFADTRDFDVEVFVVDNASTDDTVDAVSTHFPEVHLMRNTSNLGFARANNLALERSTGKYVCLVNSDIVVQRGCFGSLAGYLDAHPEAGMVGPRLLNADLSLQRSCKTFPTLLNHLAPAIGLDLLFPQVPALLDGGMTRFDHDVPAMVDAIAGAFLMVRREALVQVGPLDERFFFYGEDIDWCRRFRDFQWRVAFDPKAQAIHKHGKSSGLQPVRFYIESRRSRLLYWRKHRSFAAVAAIVMIIILHETIRMLGYALAYVFQPRRRNIAGLRAQRSAACLLWLVGFRLKTVERRDHS